MDVVCIPGIVKKSGADCGNDFSNTLCGERVTFEYTRELMRLFFISSLFFCLVLDRNKGLV